MLLSRWIPGFLPGFVDSWILEAIVLPNPRALSSSLISGPGAQRNASLLDGGDGHWDLLAADPRDPFGQHGRHGQRGACSLCPLSPFSAITCYPHQSHPPFLRAQQSSDPATRPPARVPAPGLASRQVWGHSGAGGSVSRSSNPPTI